MDTTKTHLQVHIRWMIRRDLAEVLAIEGAGFAHPWREEGILRMLRHRSCIGYVAEHGERVVGFMVYELHEESLFVTDFAVDPEFRRRGVGSQMAAKLVGKLSDYRRTRIGLVVDETNLGALLFFRDRGFVATEVLREHFPETGEDAYVMEYLFDEGRA